MFNFFKKKKQNEVKKEKPSWSPFDTAELHNYFESEVSKYFQAKGIDHEIVNGIVKIPKADFGLGELGLHNIAQYCQNNGKDAFRKNIAGHFDSLIRGHEFGKKFDEIRSDYVQVKPYVRVRMYNVDYVQHIGLDKTVGKVIAEQLYAMLVYDLPDTVESVKPSMLDEWNVPMEEVWENALENTFSEYPPIILERELQGIPFKTVEADHFFSPNIVLNMDQHPALVGSYGSLVSIPTRHIVLIYPINDINVLQALNTQILVTKGLSEKGPGSISSAIFWYHKGIMKHQPLEHKNGEITFAPTPGFVELLNDLSSQSQ